MRLLRVKARAIADIDNLVRHLARDAESYASALKLKDRILDHCAALASNPAIIGSLEPKAGKDVRRINFRNFRIFLRYSPKELTVLRIRHAATRYPH